MSLLRRVILGEVMEDLGKYLTGDRLVAARRPRGWLLQRLEGDERIALLPITDEQLAALVKADRRSKRRRTP